MRPIGWMPTIPTDWSLPVRYPACPSARTRWLNSLSVCCGALWRYWQCASKRCNAASLEAIGGYSGCIHPNRPRRHRKLSWRCSNAHWPNTARNFHKQVLSISYWGTRCHCEKSIVPFVVVYHMLFILVQLFSRSGETRWRRKRTPSFPYHLRLLFIILQAHSRQNLVAEWGVVIFDKFNLLFS